MASNKGVQRALSDLSNESKLLPILLLETSVIAGRSYHAQKRGGYYEFKETIIENVLAALVWMGGVKILNKVGDAFFKNVMNINTKMDWKQVFNEAKGRINSKEFISKTLTAKSLKLLFSVAASIYTVGVILPKFKQKLTKDSIERQKKEAAAKKAQMGAININQNNNTINNKPVSGDNSGISIPQNITYKDLLKLAQSPIGSGVKFTGKEDKNKSAQNVYFDGGTEKPGKGKNVSFTGAFDIISRIGYALENEAVPQLAVVDSGITGGRIINARNKDEAIEILFRDAASCATYFFAVPFMTKRLAGAFDAKLGINTLLDPKALDPLTNAFNKRIIEIAKANKGIIGVDDIQRAIMGTNNETVARALKNALLQSKDKVLTPDQVKNVISGLDDILAKTVTETAGLSKGQLVNQLKTYLQSIGPRAIDVAKQQADVLTSGNIRNLSNLIDDIARMPGASGEIKASAKAMTDLTKQLYGQVQSGSKITPEALKQVEGIVAKLKGSNLDDTIMKKLMESLQAVQTSSKSAGYITQEALEEVIKGGLIKDNRFLSKVLSKITPAVKDPLAYVASSEKAHLQKTAQMYAERIMKELQNNGAIKPGENVDIKKVQEVINKTLTQTKNKNMLFKGLYLIAAMAFAVLLLGWIIPKVQYAITKFRTGKDSFPGVAGLIDEEDKTNKTPQPAQVATNNNKGTQPATASNVSNNTNKNQSNSNDYGSNAFNYFLNNYKNQA
ncbi:MAG: hypothetical protein AB1782_07895 [Cyanobacteriota bacterium]